MEESIGFVISTMNRKNLDFLDEIFRNVNYNLINVVVINQCNSLPDKELVHVDDNVQCFSFLERGLSNSRNHGLSLNKSDICVLTDDDVIFDSNCINTIKKAFAENVNSDIITFRAQVSDSKYFNEYSDCEFQHNWRSILKVSSIEICLRPKNLKLKGIRYDIDFGLGAKYPSGEEVIFLKDCLDKRCQLSFVPETIVYHEEESSGAKFDEKNILTKGAMFVRIFGLFYVLANLVFALKKYSLYKDSFSLLKFIKIIFKGSFSYKK